MAGKEILSPNENYYRYDCDCECETVYGIYRHKESNEWCIDSCCGNCVAANNIKFCPFCGERIEIENKKRHSS